MKSKLLIFLILSCLFSCASYKSNQDFDIKKALEYGEHKRHIGDLYLSKKDKAPIIYLVHGGGWNGRSKSDTKNIAESLASHGFNVFNINYRLVPEVKYPAPIDDLERAVKFIEKSFPTQIDHTKVGLWGYSAGAQIVMLYGLSRKSETDAIVAGGGPYDLTWWPNSPIITPYIGHKRDENIQRWREASPITHLKKNSPKMFLYHALEDKLVDYTQMTNFEGRAKELGIPIETHSIKFWGHSSAFVFSNEAVKKGIIFLKRQFAL